MSHLIPQRMSLRVSRLLLFCLLCLGAAATTTAAACPGLPEGTLTWVIPSKPGGGYDAYSRLLQPFLERALDRRLMLINRPEAGGIVAAKTVHAAAPDGTTLGLINGAGLLAARALSGIDAPDPASQFSVLARLVTNRVVMVTGRDSGIGSVAELLERAAEGPVLVGVRDAGSASFISLPISASLLGLDYAVVSGYVGISARTMAALRSEVDILFVTFDSARRHIDSGDLVPLLQITEAQNPDAAMVSRDLDEPIPVLGGANGLAVAHAARTGRTPQQAEREAEALANIFASGRLVVGPPGMSPALSECLGGVLLGVLESSELRLAAKRAQLSIEPADSESAERSLKLARRQLQDFLPLIERAVNSLRQP